MKISTLKNLAVLTALAVMAGITGKAHAVIPNNWVILGPSAGGGVVIIGNSAPADLGQLGPFTTPVSISTTGSDVITLFAGNTASASNFVIDLQTPNNVLNNYGTIHGLTTEGVKVFNNGNAVNNWGTITSQSYTVDIEANNNILNNWNVISNTTNGGEPVYIAGQNNIINNYKGATITSPYDAVWEQSGAHNTFNNWGTISATGTGGQYGVYSDGSFFTLNNWGLISVEGAGNQAVFSDGGNATVNNWGQVISAGDGADIYGANNVVNNYAQGSISSGSIGIYLSGSNNTINNHGMISGDEYGINVVGSFNTVNNWGTITSLSEGVENDTNSNTYNNWGTIYGSDEGFYLDEDYNTINNWGTIASADEAFFLNEPFNVINNWGTFSGGNYALYINDSNNVINNWGTFTIPSTGVYAVYFSSSYHGNVLNNWGMITSNGGPIAIDIHSHDNTLNLDGHSSVIGKIKVTGANNTVNLNFTGVPATMLPGLNASLLAQGANTGTPTNVQLTLRQVSYNIDPAIVNINLSSYQLQGLTPNQRAIGAGLDSLAFNPAPGTPLFNLLNAIDTSGNVPAALSALSPEDYGAYGDLAIANSTAIVQIIDGRLNNVNDGSESIDTTGVGGESTTAGFSKDEGKSSKEIVTAPEKRWGFFATGDGLFYRAQGTKSNDAGTLAGVDGKVGEHGVIGAFFSYNNADAKLGASATHATIESFSGGIYGAWHDNGYYVNSLAAYTRNNYNSQRSIAFPGFANSVAGSTNGNQVTVNLDGGYDFKINDRLTVGPIGGLQYVHLSVDGFNESGAGGLAIGSQDMDSLQSRLGGRLDYHIKTGQYSSFAAELHAAWQHEFLNDSRSIGAGFGGGSLPFNVQTASPQRDAAVVGVGLNWTFHDRLTLFADYELTVWKSSSTNQTINGGLRIKF